MSIMLQIVMPVQVPAVILVCRNSTDTAYFQRLRPYPRIMLLRCNTRFKDYVRPPVSCLHLRPCLVPCTGMIVT